MTDSTTARVETGGPNRTPRSEITPAVSANRKKEPVLLLDLSGDRVHIAQHDTQADEYEIVVYATGSGE